MKYHQWSLRMGKLTCLAISLSFITGCSSVPKNQTDTVTIPAESEELNIPPDKTNYAVSDFTYDVNPETFQLSITANGKQEIISLPLISREVIEIESSNNRRSWRYPSEKIEISIEKQPEYLDVKIISEDNKTSDFTWPSVKADSYLMPFGEGKMFRSDDEIWKEYLDGNVLSGIESLSMQFFTAQWSDFSAVYIATNPYDNELHFTAQTEIQMDWNHEFPSINHDREYGFRIYITDNTPVSSAKIYRNYVIDQGKFKTLTQKAQENENIEKLYGAPHIYFYPANIISKEDIVWGKLKDSITPEFMTHIISLLENDPEGKDYLISFDELNDQKEIYQYTKTQLVRAFNHLMLKKDFYSSQVFKEVDKQSQILLDLGIDKLNQAQLLKLNKGLLAGQIKEAVKSPETWSVSDTVSILEDMKTSGLTNAWIGLDEWTKGLYNESFVQKAVESGYLIGPYDSYHSIHKPGEEKWSTAQFTDSTLYEKATVRNEKGEFYEGFQGEGRKLNPTLAMPSVKERVDMILSNGLTYNSWFVDCDATGEIYNDYSPEHPATQKQDLDARRERLSYLITDKNMVVGSEGGNDFANDIIAFAHGIETPAFSWMDGDMNKNKDSEYYLGRYYAPTGGVPEVFSKVTKVKDYYIDLFISPKYSIPLYKLVYNDSIITTHQWGWPTTKIENAKETRMLKEILYNVPPLYQVDAEFWNTNKEEIVSHSTFYETFSPAVINKEMTDFQILTDDRMVQKTSFGNEVQVIANFSDSDFSYEDTVIKAGTLNVVSPSGITQYNPLSSK